MPFLVTYSVEGKTWGIPCPTLPRAEAVAKERVKFYGGEAVIVDQRAAVYG